MPLTTISLCHLPQRYDEAGLNHQALEIKATYRVPTPHTLSPDDSRRPIVLEISPRDVPTIDEDITATLLKALRIPSVKEIVCDISVDPDGSTHGDPPDPEAEFDHSLRFDYASICDALKKNTWIKSFRTYGIELIDDNIPCCYGKGTPGIQNLFATVAEGHPTLEEVHMYLEVDAGSFCLSSRINCLINYKGADYGCWFKTMTALNLNKLGKNRLNEESTSVSEFLERIHPQAIRDLTKLSAVFVRPSWDHGDCPFLLTNDISLETLNYNYEFLQEQMGEWIPVFYQDDREINLLYGMLREAPLIWCRPTTSVERRGSSNKKRKAVNTP